MSFASEGFNSFLIHFLAVLDYQQYHVKFSTFLLFRAEIT
jgi:hypothetical protein